jgi:SAM-dependent methyltransferase
VIGLDYSHASLLAGARIAAGQAPGPRAYIQADATSLPVRGSRFDAVISVDVIDVLPPVRHAAFLAELLRAARPGGRVIVYTPNARREAFGRWIRPVRRWLGRWRQPECPLHIGLLGPCRFRRLLQELGAQGELRFADMNYPWLARLPLLRGWLAGHMLWTITREARVE